MSRDKTVGQQGIEPLDYGSTAGRGPSLFGEREADRRGVQVHESPHRLIHQGIRPRAIPCGEKADVRPSPREHTGTETSISRQPLTSPLFGGGALNGYTPELIAYGRTLTPLERRQVETYLAIRYGITLNGSYYTGTDNLSWDRDESAAYPPQGDGRSGVTTRATSSSLSPRRATRKHQDTLTERHTTASETQTHTACRRANAFSSWGVRTARPYPTAAI